MKRWPERKLAAVVRCQECDCVSEDAREWIAKIVEDDEEPETENRTPLRRGSPGVKPDWREILRVEKIEFFRTGTAN